LKPYFLGGIDWKSKSSQTKSYRLNFASNIFHGCTPEKENTRPKKAKKGHSSKK